MFIYSIVGQNLNSDIKILSQISLPLSRILIWILIILSFPILETSLIFCFNYGIFKMLEFFNTYFLSKNFKTKTIFILIWQKKKNKKIVAGTW